MSTLQFRYGVEELGEPCRNFNILASLLITDSLDGKEKLVLSNFALGSTGSLIFIDPQTGEGETVNLPADSGAWALCSLQDEKLLVGTCAQYGYLHCLDLKSRTWAKPLRCEGETYIWNLVQGSDGRVYGGTYPGCSLLRYDPATHTLDNLGRVSGHPANLYSRTVYGGVPGKIIISGGFETSFVTVWDIAREENNLLAESSDGEHRFMVKERTADYFAVEYDGKTDNYDAETCELLPAAPQTANVTENLAASVSSNHQDGWLLRDGRRIRIKGQEYIVTSADGLDSIYKTIPAERPETAIHTITSDGTGKIWGSSGFGQTIFYYDPKRKSSWNSLTVCNHGGEVYGMQFVEGRLYMTAYSGGDHIVYDPLQPWNQRDNLNPKTLQSIGPEWIRPCGRSVLGPDGAVWTGWAAQYGVYGGAISRVDPQTEEVTLWEAPVDGQQVVGVAADSSYLYLVTNGGGNGLPAKPEPGRFVIWSIAEGRKSAEYALKNGEEVGAVLPIQNAVLLREGKSLLVFDCSTKQFTDSIYIGLPCTCLVAYDEYTAAAFCGDVLYWIDCRDWTAQAAAKLPGTVGTAVRTPDGALYFASGRGLYRLQAGEG